MKLVIFLGNPGLKYRKTRHNIGFIFGDFLIKKLKIKWKFDKKFNADIARKENTIFAKPQLFYNCSGEVVRKIMDFYKINLSDITVICDDLNLDFGIIRERTSGSDGGNNGLKSIINTVGSDFRRIRVGTNNETRPVVGDIDFVLSKFSKEEQFKLSEIFNIVNKKL